MQGVLYAYYANRMCPWGLQRIHLHNHRLSVHTYDTMWTIVGLGNPDSVYEHTRHNFGRAVVTWVAQKHGISNWKKEQKKMSVTARGTLHNAKVLFVLPETYMNDSGLAIQAYISSPKQASHLVVLHDDLDLPLGKIKVSFGSGSGGHKGVASIQKALKTRDFIRLRLGVSAATASGKLKKPHSEKVIEFVLGAFRTSEQEKLKIGRKLAEKALEALFTEGLARAMNETNGK